MHYTQVIKAPIITEKTNILAQNNNEFVFKVDIRTNKIEVKKVIEHLYQVKVERVNIIRLEKEPTQLGRSKGFTKRYKKAIVKLAKGYSISFSEQEQEVSKEAKAIVKESDKKETKEKLDLVEEKIAAKLAKEKEN